MQYADFSGTMQTLRNLEEAAKNGDEYAQRLKKGLDECSLSVLSMNLYQYSPAKYKQSNNS